MSMRADSLYNQFILSGIKGVVDMWIKGGFKEKEGEIARIIRGFSLAE